MFIFRMIAGWFGYLIVNKKKNHLDIHMHLGNLFRSRSINCVVDVGANRGQYGLELRQNGYTGHIFSFEPVKSSFELLKAVSAKDKRWLVFNYALGSEDTKRTINVTGDTVFSSFLSPSEYSRQHITDKTTITKTEEVYIRRLDDVAKEIHAVVRVPSVYLKMDTQGYDLEVLKGAGDFINEILGMQSEISMIPLYEGMPDFLEALRVYRTYGFEITGFYPAARDPESLIVLEYDCVMVRGSR